MCFVPKVCSVGECRSAVTPKPIRTPGAPIAWRQQTFAVALRRLQTACNSLGQNCMPLSESLPRGLRQKGMYRFMGTWAAPSAASKFGSSDNDHVSTTARTAHERKSRSTTGRDRKMAEKIDSHCDTGLSGQGNWNDGQADGQPRAFSCLALEKMTKPPSRAYILEISLE